MIKTLLIIIFILVLFHFLCGSVCVFFYLDKLTVTYFNIGDILLMIIFGPWILLIFIFLYIIYIIDTVFKKLKKKIYERKTKI